MTPWTVAGQAPLSMESSRQEYWGGLTFPSPWDLPDPGIEPGSPELQVDSLPSEPPGKLMSSSKKVSITDLFPEAWLPLLVFINGKMIEGSEELDQ